MFNRLWFRMLSRFWEGRAEVAMFDTCKAILANDIPAAKAGVDRHVSLTRQADNFARRAEA